MSSNIHRIIFFFHFYLFYDFNWYKNWTGIWNFIWCSGTCTHCICSVYCSVFIFYLLKLSPLLFHGDIKSPSHFIEIFNISYIHCSVKQCSRISYTCITTGCVSTSTDQALLPSLFPFDSPQPLKIMILLSTSLRPGFLDSTYQWNY